MANSIFKVTKQCDMGISVSSLNVKSKKQAEELGKKQGKYRIINISKNMLYLSGYREKVADVLTAEIKLFFKEIGFNKKSNILCCGIGNNQIIADSFGPKTVKKIIVDNISKGEQFLVKAINPDVKGKTGIDTLEYVNAIAKLSQAKHVVMFDSLSTDERSRIGLSVQLSSNVLVPGEGLGQKNKKDNLNKLNCLSVGAVLVNVFSEQGAQYVCMPCDIEFVTNSLADITARAVNCALYGKGYKKIY